jgi:O-antigen ligase
MTILARSGLIGLALWLVMLCVSFAAILKAALAARRASDQEDELLGVWFLSYLMLILVVSMFGVVLEAPHGAVPFFLILGLAMGWTADHSVTKPRYPIPQRMRR